MSTPDPAQLAPLLASVLPYLLKGALELAKSAIGELGQKLSADAWDGLKSLAAKIQNKAESKPALHEALTDAQSAPTDADTQAALRLQLKKLLAEDPALLAEAAHLLTRPQTEGRTVTAPGTRSVVIGGDASGNIIITGDNNQVRR